MKKISVVVVKSESILNIGLINYLNPNYSVVTVTLEKINKKLIEDINRNDILIIENIFSSKLSSLFKIPIILFLGAPFDFLKLISIKPSGVILNTDPAFFLEDAIKKILEGETYLSMNFKNSNYIAETTINFYKNDNDNTGKSILTKREKEILKLYNSGFRSTEEMAQRMIISKRTVSKHRDNIFRKLKVSSIKDAIKVFEI